MEGRIDNINAAVLRGWGWNPAMPEQRLVGRVFVDEIMIGEVVLDQPRGDLAAAKIGDGAHGFRLQLPIALQDGRDHVFRLDVDGETGPVTLHSRMLQVAERGIVGRFERVVGGICQGWALDNRDPERRLTVEILAGDVILAEAHALHLRKDLQRLGLGDGRYGFNLQLPASLLRKAQPGQMLVARVRGSDDEPPKQIGSLPLPSKELVKALVMRGRYAQQQGQRAEAIAIFEDLLKLDPENVDGLWRLARLLVSEGGDRARARALAERADRLKPALSDVNLILARLAHEEERYEEALSRWMQIAPGESAYRESLIKAGRCLQHLSRPVEAIVPARKALALNRADVDAIRLLAESYMLVGAPQLALPHWRTLSDLQPRDRRVQSRLTQAQASAGVSVQQDAPEPLMVLRNPALRAWNGAAIGEVRHPVQLAQGVVLRPLVEGEPVGYRIAKPQEFKPNGFPYFGLYLSAGTTGFELEHRLDPEKAELLRQGVRISFEVEVPSGAVEARLELWLRDAAAPEGASRQLWCGQAGSMPQLAWCDLRLEPAEGELLLADRLVLVLRAPDPAAVLWNPPRPVRRLSIGVAWPSAAEGPALPERLKRLSTPAGQELPRFRLLPAPTADEAWSMAHPYTALVLWAKPGAWDAEALDRSLAALQRAENLPAVFRIVTSPATADLAAAWLAARHADPRLSLRPNWRPRDESADWIAFLRAGTAPPARWLRDLHDEARRKGSGVCGDRDMLLIRRGALEAREGGHDLVGRLVGSETFASGPAAVAPAKKASPQLMTGER
ncbi:tetratricopeptide repeat protein [Roseomonas chloroacetimidivorans]|uniref:tetratricopeptide repeat protein n=1 Tax=Roseomonas chloroacetimidivorans TaxID=1766656 RepID=UPI003C734F1D